MALSDHDDGLQNDSHDLHGYAEGVVSKFQNQGFRSKQDPVLCALPDFPISGRHFGRYAALIFAFQFATMAT